MNDVSEDPQDLQGELVRIGELSRRVGVSDHTLRAWENRYGLLRPHRTAGGFRLYSGEDEDRVRRMSGLLDRGLSSAEAARVVLSVRDSSLVDGEADGSGDGAERDHSFSDALAGVRRAIARSLDAFDDTGAHAALDRMLAGFAVETVLRDVVIPFMHEQGERWQRGEITLIQEHFATQVIRGRLAGLARGWAGGTGPRVVLACPSGELHDVASMAFGIIMRAGGWRVVFLGANTPIPQLETSMVPPPDLVVLSATRRTRFEAIRSDIAEMTAWVPVGLAGAGSTRALAESTGAFWLPGDPVTEAQRVLRREIDLARPNGESKG